MSTFAQILMKLTNDMVGVFDSSWRPVELNDHWTTVLGWSREELMKTSFRDLINPSDVERAIQDYLASSGSYSGNYGYRCKNGNYKFMALNIQPDPETRNSIIVGRDVTRQSIFDKTIEKFSQPTKVGVWNLDTNTLDGYFSPEVYTMFGLAPDKDVLKFNEIGHYYSAEDWIRIQNAMANLRAGGDFNLEVLIHHADGKQLPVRLLGAAVNEQGVADRLVGTIQDLTDERKVKRELDYREGLLNGLINSSPAVVYIKNLNGQYVMVSRQFKRLFSHMSDIVGKTDADLFAPEVAERHRNTDAQVIEARAPIKLSDHMSFDGGKEVHFISEKFPLFDEKGTLIALGGVSTDITDLYDYEKKLRDEKDKVVAGTRAKANFLEDMSHEIRTPLSSIIGMTDILEDLVTTEEQRNVLRILSRASESLMKIINNFLDLSRSESGEIKFENLPYSISELVKSCTELLEKSASDKSINMVAEIHPDVPDKVFGDFMRIQQVLVNLLGNSIKFTQKGSICLKVSRLKDRKNRDALRFEVEDTGIGMTPEQTMWIFARFTQADVSIPRRFGGSGLGLSISKELVERMDGEMKVESTPGKGSRFYFDLPLYDPESSYRN